MLTIDDFSNVPLNHIADFIEGDRNFIVAASMTGVVSVIDPDRTIHAHFRTLSEISGLSIHPSKDLFAISLTDGQIQLFNFSGMLVDNWSLENEALGCVFDETGSKILCISRETVEEISFDLFVVETDGEEPKFKRNNSTVVIDDPFIESACLVSSNKFMNTVYLSVVGEGQQQGYLVTIGDKLLIKMEATVRALSPLSFSPSGHSFLVCNSQNTIGHYEYPSFAELGSSSWEDGNDTLSFFCFLTKKLALAISRNGRVFTLNTEKLVILNEVEISGHETKSSVESFGSAHDYQCTDLWFLHRIQDTVVMAFRNDMGGTIPRADWKDTIICVSSERLL